MLDPKQIINDLDAALEQMRKRDPNASFDELLTLHEKRRQLVGEHNDLRHKQRTLSKGFGDKGLSDEERSTLRAELKVMSDGVKDLDDGIKAVEVELNDWLMNTPNLPDPSTPAGQTEDDNVLIRSWGTPREHDFEGQDHDALGEALGILDFDAAARISGARFALYRGLGARLERALASFMLDMHTDSHGYEEVLTPFLVRREAMIGTGQLPKFEDDAFRTEPDDMFLIPTAEVSVTNILREQMLAGTDLPIKFTAFSPCFRREAGSYGRDVRGLTRTHQFQKVEMVQFTREEDSEAAHEALTGHAEAILQALNLPYRVMQLCGGDLGFGAAKCYDIEVWLPVQQCWREISSCSNYRDFQARRADIRYRPEPGAKPRFVHTLNGSGLAIGRTVMALIENYQTADGRLLIPDALQPYMRVSEIAPSA